MKTLGEMMDEVGRAVGRPDTTYESHIKQFINLAVRDYVRAFPSVNTRRRITFDATAQSSQALYSDVDMPVWFLDVTNSRQVDPGQDWDRRYASYLSTPPSGSPVEWQPDGIWPVIRHPEHKAIRVHVGTETVQLRGNIYDSAYDGGALEIKSAMETLTATGGTAGSYLDSGYTWYRLDSIARTTRGTAAIAIEEDLDGYLFEVGRIEPGELGSRYYWVRWLRKPSTGLDIMMEYIPVTKTLQNDGDAVPPFISTDYVYWNAVHQAASDLGDAEMIQLARNEGAKVTINEARKEFGFGDRMLQITPVWDDQTNIDGVQLW